MPPDEPGRAARGDREAPAVPGVIHGLRSWALYQEGPFWRLGSRTRATIWPPNESLVAHCVATQERRHRAPDPGCGCGLHAYHPFGAGVTGVAELFAAPEPGYANGAGWTVFGVISAWGRIEVHSEGFRAERARPVALLTAENWRGTAYGRAIEETAAEYVLPVVEIEPDANAIAERCAEQWPGLAPALVDDLLPPV